MQGLDFTVVAALLAADLPTGVWWTVRHLRRRRPCSASSSASCFALVDALWLAVLRYPVRALHVAVHGHAAAAAAVPDLFRPRPDRHRHSGARRRHYRAQPAFRRLQCRHLPRRHRRRSTRARPKRARSIGFGEWQTRLYIVVPQALRNTVPAVGNMMIALLKESAIVSMIGIAELVHSAQLAISETYRPFEFYLTAAALYYVLNLVLEAGPRPDRTQSGAFAMNDTPSDDRGARRAQGLWPARGAQGHRSHRRPRPDRRRDRAERLGQEHAAALDQPSGNARRRRGLARRRARSTRSCRAAPSSATSTRCASRWAWCSSTSTCFRI